MDGWKDIKINQGVRDLTRSKIKPWVQKVLRENNSKCIITGEETCCVHHVVPYIDLLKMTMYELNISYKESYSDYAKEELDLIASKCLEMHFLHGEGAPLKQKLHEIFHSEYGIHKHTKEDFQEFVSRASENIEGFYQEHAEKFNVKPEFSINGMQECMEDIECSMQMIKLELTKRRGVHVDLVKDMFETIKMYSDLAIAELPDK